MVSVWVTGLIASEPGRDCFIHFIYSLEKVRPPSTTRTMPVA